MDYAIWGVLPAERDNTCLQTSTPTCRQLPFRVPSLNTVKLQDIKRTAKLYKSSG